MTVEATRLLKPLVQRVARRLGEHVGRNVSERGAGPETDNAGPAPVRGKAEAKGIVRANKFHQTCRGIGDGMQAQGTIRNTGSPSGDRGVDASIRLRRGSLLHAPDYGQVVSICPTAFLYTFINGRSIDGLWPNRRSIEVQLPLRLFGSRACHIQFPNWRNSAILRPLQTPSAGDN
jgi:hypothetical protein